MLARVIVGVLLAELLLAFLAWLSCDGEVDTAAMCVAVVHAIFGGVFSVYLFLVTLGWVLTGEWAWDLQT